MKKRAAHEEITAGAFRFFGKPWSFLSEHSLVNFSVESINLRDFGGRLNRAKGRHLEPQKGKEIWEVQLERPPMDVCAIL